MKEKSPLNFMNPYGIMVPAEKTNSQLGEFDIQEVLAQVIGEPNEVNLQTFTAMGRSYEVNLGSDRYHLFKKSLECACCGIRATRCYLEQDKQNSKEQGRDLFHLNFYAEASKSGGKIHLILMTRDHVIPRSTGGDNDITNGQTLCYNCNDIKDAYPFTNEQIRKLMFPAYRAYASSIALNMAKELVKPLRFKIESARRGIENVTRALEVVKDDRSIAMRQRIVDWQQQIVELTERCNQIELKAQITGSCPISLDVA
jgi:5-methylcytosine-specific restriction endonuclease McrA